MRLSRQSKAFVAMFVFVSILFSQFAVAAYACPGSMGDTTVALTAVVSDANDHAYMADCSEHSSMVPSALCHAHCQPDGQSLDRAVHPDISPFIATTLIASLIHPLVTRQTVALRIKEGYLIRVTAPPISVRNCCFRI